MARRLNIGVDVDGVLGCFTCAAREVLKRMFNGKPADNLVQTQWGFDSLGVTKEEEDQLWAEIDATPNWWMDEPRMPATNYLRHLTEAARVVFITDRKDGVGMPVEEQTAKWLENTFHVWRPNVVISGDKGFIAKGLKLDYFVDDRPKNVDAVLDFYPECKSYILDATYNQEYKRAPRVHGFDDFARLCLPLEVLDKDDYGRCVA